MMRITCLAGGVGAARFLEGLVKITNPEKISAIVNTGDDITLYGLHISPDIDIVTYTLAGIVDQSKGWGMKEDTYNCLTMLTRYGYDPWFQLGDKDIATHINRTKLLDEGHTLTQVTDLHRKKLGVKPVILPMTDDKFETHIQTDKELIHFQKYLVKQRAEDSIKDIYYKGAGTARPTPTVLEEIKRADTIIICPSNPLVSIGTILAIKGVHDTITRSKAVKIGISPIVGGTTIKGPADRMMKNMGMEVSAYGVADYYKDLIDIFVIDKIDSQHKTRIEELGLTVCVTDTIMKDMQAKKRLALETLKVSEKWRKN